MGYKPEEMLGKYFYDFFLPDQREALKNSALAAFAAKEPFLNFLNPNLHKDGRTIWLATSGIPILDEQVNANLLCGHFGPEAALLVEAGDRKGSLSVAGSDSLTGQAVFYATAQEPLIGEEIFAVPAYLEDAPMKSSSLKVQDILRWTVIAGLLAGSLLKLVGIL